MTDDVFELLKVRVPLIVRLAERQMTLGQVLSLAPGSIVELPKEADEPLDILINNKHIGTGTAVKVRENFGIRVDVIGDGLERVQAAVSNEETSEEDAELAALAEQMLSGQF